MSKLVCTDSVRNCYLPGPEAQRFRFGGTFASSCHVFVRTSKSRPPPLAEASFCAVAFHRRPSRRAVDSVSSHNSAASTHLEHTNRQSITKELVFTKRKIDAMTLMALLETKGNAPWKGHPS